MSGPAQRNLTLTEELEKLEQSITLTLQEIDSNFSRAHRIVTTSILPVVEQYAEHSKDVWEGAKFWKQFFEASANVSLSGYEENPNEDTTEQEQTVTEDTTNITNTSSLGETASYETPSSEHLDLGHHESELDLSSLTISPSHSTPRPGKNAQAFIGVDETPSSIAGYPPPAVYDEDENGNTSNKLGHEDYSSLPEHGNEPVTPGRYTTGRYQSAETPMSSPFIPPPSTTTPHNQPSTSKKKSFQKPTDPVLHHVLDKTYRVQATPLSKGHYYKPTKFSVATTPKGIPHHHQQGGYDDSPLSSPELEAPKLHEEIFASPIRKNRELNTPGTAARGLRPRSSPQKMKSRGTPKPGISVLTPGKPRTTTTTIGNNNNSSSSTKDRNTWDSDEEEEKFLDDDEDDTDIGFSPPKTMQFHIPHSRLMKTPAKEASKRIVSDLLATAGGDGHSSSSAINEDEEVYDDSVELAGHSYYSKYGGGAPGGEEHSPTIVRSGGRLEDDTF